MIEEHDKLEALIKDFCKNSKHLEQVLVIPVFKEDCAQDTAKVMSKVDNVGHSIWGVDKMSPVVVALMFERLRRLLAYLFQGVFVKSFPPEKST